LFVSRCRLDALAAAELSVKEGRMAKALVLRTITGAQAGTRRLLKSRTNTIGSASTNDLVLHDRMISPRHAEIRQTLERWFIVPLTGNGQGLSLNGMPISSQSRLNEGDVLSLGGTSYIIGFEEVVEREVGTRPASAGTVPRLGNYFIRRGIMTTEQIARVLERQTSLQDSGSQLPFGQVAYDMGYINRSQLDMALADQRGDFNDRFRD
jgi:hypothetical protein